MDDRSFAERMQREIDEKARREQEEQIKKDEELAFQLSQQYSEEYQHFLEKHKEKEDEKEEEEEEEEEETFEEKESDNSFEESDLLLAQRLQAEFDKEYEEYYYKSICKESKPQEEKEENGISGDCKGRSSSSGTKLEKIQVISALSLEEEEEEEQGNEREEKPPQQARTSKKKKDDMKKVTVAIRIRPFINKEKYDQSQNVLTRRNKIFVARTGKNVMGEEKNIVSTFQNFDHIYLGSGQYQIYHDIGKNVVRACCDYMVNSTVFAYGQTGSGKTYTMLGNMNQPKKDGKRYATSLFDAYRPLFHLFPVEIVSYIHSFIPDVDFSNLGLIPRICRKLFQTLREKYRCPETGRYLYQVKVRFVEIYNDQTRDLLEKKPKAFLKGQVKATNYSVRVYNCEKHVVESYEKVLTYLRNGLSHRVTKATKGNRVSSRSHAVFTIFIRTFSFKNNRRFTDRKINLIDLAGSEKYSKKGYSLARQKEGLFINKSLLELGRCLGIAADRSKSSKKDHHTHFVPVRSNILTLLLKDSLGGVSKTFMIANISPCKKDVNESFCTLNYAHRCKRIRLKVKKGEVGDWVKKLIILLRFRCRCSRKRLEILRKFETFKRRTRKPKNYSLRMSMYYGQYRRVQNQINLQNAKILRFLIKKLDLFDKEVVNDAIIAGLEGCALEFHEVEIAGCTRCIERRFSRNDGWKYQDFEELLV